MMTAVLTIGAALITAAVLLGAWAYVSARAEREAARERAAIRAAIAGEHGPDAGGPEWLAARLAAAGVAVKPRTAIAWCAAGTALAAFVGAASSGLIGAVVLAACVPAGAWLVLAIRAKRASSGFEEQLARFLPMLERNMRAGQTFENAAKAAAAHMEDPLKARFTELAAARAAGASLPQAVDALAKRTGSSDAAMLAAAVGVQAETGGALADVVASVSETVTRRVRTRRKLKAITAQGRMSAAVVFIMPFALALALGVLSPGYFDPIMKEPLGLALMVGAFALALIGALVVVKMLKMPIY